MPLTSRMLDNLSPNQDMCHDRVNVSTDAGTRHTELWSLCRKNPLRGALDRYCWQRTPSPLGVRYMEYLFMVSGVLHSFP